MVDWHSEEYSSTIDSGTTKVASELRLQAPSTRLGGWRSRSLADAGLENYSLREEGATMKQLVRKEGASTEIALSSVEGSAVALCGEEGQALAK